VTVYPLPAFCFRVELEVLGEKTAEAFFKSVGGIKYETEVVPVRAGGVNDRTYNLPGAVKWAPIVLRRGFTGDPALLRWREQWINGTGKRVATGTIVQLDTEFHERARWVFERGWPTKWEIGELDASKNELVIETLEIAIEKLRSEPVRAAR
jgi:phage tail-like protein